ncbi:MULTISPECIES: rhomboid family intramembrane serine protease [Cryobacterium]|uniref:Rhomboid family intramembrane serine protease n=1 Tax=Cryobacterium glucosi TaxID=1259175 RepID=A0ABY2IUJ9_9MICO|nr:MULTISPECIES: rhomboid family intramembrane serine protease [Cryobacterium]MDY7529657.1 rhomboid family intramembrane serine protease [Cryobacterium sp. 10C2]MDY7558205.1 rhomboid family intramembrane serine protease [Cryobacterium sp. 10C3]MEB0001524.1 rhomboid family intramembrane serine protease [Cryobacterium sp. RTC2.1]MEB0202127.1 rhomboid family intramembrane serine protease [Cryobacterium sp. 5I3]MEB0286101.1 rhomboid family intramembrane serine protease [Cryobacterium sp. 10S3]
MTDLPGSAANFCYRHPGRQSFILCQRCGRTICPECQTQAAVGVICPECMKEQRQNAPRTRPALLTRISSSRGPVVTYGIIGVTFAVFLLQLVPGFDVTSALLYAGIYSYPGSFEPWRMLTSVFVHSTGFIFHVLLNMYTLWIFGQILEGMLGRGRFLALYLLSGLAGSLGVLFLAGPLTPVVGASGAIFGLMGAFLVIQRRLGGNSTQLLILVGINLVIGFLPNLNVAWQAHVGGLIGGAILGLIYVQTRRSKHQSLQNWLVAAFAIVLVALSFVKFLG